MLTEFSFLDELTL